VKRESISLRIGKVFSLSSLLTYRASRLTNNNKHIQPKKSNKMKRIAFAVAAVSLMIIFSCSKEVIFGDGPVVTETRAVNNFRGLSASIPGKINYKVDAAYKVEIHAQRNVIDAMRTEVINGIIYIDFRDNVRIRRHDDIVVNISAPYTELLRLSGTGDITAEGDLVINKLELEVSGSGSIAVQKAAVADKIDARISGSGNMVILAGSAKNEELRISGSGSMDFANVPAERAEAHISGSGDVRVNLSQSLDASISGSGSIYYKGNPVISTRVSGSGRVKPL
jgi:hypothetical protein